METTTTLDVECTGVRGPCAGVSIAPEELAGVKALYERGLYLQAYQQASALAPLKSWTGTAARVLAGRLAVNLGGPRLATWHHYKAWRRDPTDPEAMWFYAYNLIERRGAWAAWRFISSHAMPPEANDEHRAHWLALKAGVLGRLRDFDEAEQWLAQAEALGERPWVCVERAGVLALEDRHDDAERWARRALELRPWYRPAVQWVVHFLVQRERDDEALSLLSEATTRLESFGLLVQLATLLHEQQRYEEIGPVLDACERHAPLLEKALAQWLTMRRADLAYYLGDLDRARELAKTIGAPFFTRLAERLARPPAERRRVVLPVGFVRQNYQTCAPATLAAIARHWSMPGDHLEMAATITYGGTPHHSERNWAEEHGWRTKEFTVTWESACALIDRGVPFTLTTTELSSSHLQAVIGYDNARGTFLIRDPGERHQAESDAAALLERYQATGPRGMALVPKDQAERLDLPLPDEALYDQMHRFDRALQRHRRDEAADACRALEAAAPTHRLTYLARRVLGWYDANPTEVLAWTDKMLELYPNDLGLQVAKASCLRDLARREERLTLLRELAERKETDPACWGQYAQELALDPREHDQARYLLRRVLRTMPGHYSAYWTLAQLLWDQRRFSEALELYRFAFCLEDKIEPLARAYFQCARAVGRTGEVLQLLERRFERFGRNSPHPARTLAWAYRQLERTSEAIASLRRALELRPDDGELKLQLADTLLQAGEYVQAETMLEQARNQSPPGEWLRTAATIAYAIGDLKRCCDLWKQVTEREPLAEDAQRAYAQHLAETQGRAAAQVHLDSICRSFPYHCGLHRLRIEWAREEGPAAVEQAVRETLVNVPGDAWLRRELSMALADQGRLDEAFAELEEAARLEPMAIALYACQGRLYGLAGRAKEAREACRKALQASVDFQVSIHDYLQTCDTLDERRAALKFVEQELIRQVTFGEGLLAFRDAAAYTLEPAELLETLRSGLRARPDLWHAWAAVIRQLTAMNELDEALTEARTAVERFPHLPALRLDLANVYRALKDDIAEIETLNEVLRIAPGWSLALRQLAEAHERQGRSEEAVAVLRQAIARAPLVGFTYQALGEVLWRRGERAEAIEQMLHALRLDPGNETAWSRLCDWTVNENQFDRAIDYARDLTKSRAGEARSWIRLAQALHRAGRQPDAAQENARIAECVSAFDAALAHNPRLGDAYDQKACFLAELGRFAEARAACRPKIWGDRPPLQLRAREAWLIGRQGDFPAAINAMRAVLAEDRNYYWMWLQLAEALRATGRYDEFLEAAEQLVRLAPQGAEALAYRGEARLRKGDRASGLADLEAAFALAPGHQFAGLVLVDEYLLEADLEAAERVLAQLERLSGGDYIQARRVRLLAKQKRAEEAAAVFSRLCRGATLDPWPLDTAARALQEAGWSERLDQILAEAMRDPAHHPHVALLRGERWNAERDTDLDDRLRDLQEALPRLADPLRPLDLQAELLALAGRFDEALRVCATPSAPTTMTALRGRAAWILWLRGDRTQAIDAMKQVVSEDPGYFWGWSQLAEWQAAMGNPAGQLEAAAQLITIAPHDAFGWVHRAGARLALGNSADAVADYRKATELAPAYPFAAFQLFDLLVKRAEFSEAERALERIRPHCDPADYELRMLELAIAQDRKSALWAKHLQELCKHTAAKTWHLTDALARLTQAHKSADAAKVLRGCLDAGPHVCEAWVRLECQQGRWEVRDELAGLPGDSPGKPTCLAAYAGMLGSTHQREALRHFVEDFRLPLTKTTRAWGLVGSAFYQAGDDQGAAEWLKEFKSYPDAEPWMLLNLVVPLRCLGKLDQAHEVSAYACGQLKPDHTTSWHQTWLLFDAAPQTPAADAQAEIRRLRLTRLDDYHRFILALAEAVTVSGSGVPDAFRQARRILADAARKSPPIFHDIALASTYQTALERIAGNSGGLSVRLWKWYRRVAPLLPPKPMVKQPA